MALVPTRFPLSWSRNACDLDLPQLIDEAREEWAGELAIPMTVARPPALTAIDGHGDSGTDNAYGARIGYSLSAPLVKRLGSPKGYGNVFPMARSLHELAGWCRGRHIKGAAGPWDDHLADVALGDDLQRPLCARLAWAVVVWEATPAWAARQEPLPVLRAARLLTTALQRAWELRREWAHGDDSGVPEVLASMRRSRRAARSRAEASAGGPCRYCAGPYDAASTIPCPGSEGNRMSEAEAATFAATYPGAALLCAPVVSAFVH
jgi:hypothetical protein